jgi:hypothetical protein
MPQRALDREDVGVAWWDEMAESLQHLADMLDMHVAPFFLPLPPPMQKIYITAS